MRTTSTTSRSSGIRSRMRTCPDRLPRGRPELSEPAGMGRRPKTICMSVERLRIRRSTTSIPLQFPLRRIHRECSAAAETEPRPRTICTSAERRRTARSTLAGRPPPPRFPPHLPNCRSEVARWRPRLGRHCRGRWSSFHGRAAGRTGQVG